MYAQYINICRRFEPNRKKRGWRQARAAGFLFLEAAKCDNNKTPPPPRAPPIWRSRTALAEGTGGVAGPEGGADIRPGAACSHTGGCRARAARDRGERGGGGHPGPCTGHYPNSLRGRSVSQASQQGGAGAQRATCSRMAAGTATPRSILRTILILRDRRFEIISKICEL